MRVYAVSVTLAVVMAAGCQQGNEGTNRAGVPVSRADEAPVRVDRAPSPEDRKERTPIEVSPADPVDGLQGASNEPAWTPRLRQLCKEVAAPEERDSSERATKNSDQWKGKLDLKVTDFHIYSPTFKKWTLEKVDNRLKLARVRGKGWYGFGLAVEMANNSDQVLTGDNIYVWATFKSKAGKRFCFADAVANRSYNPYAKKGKGAWVKEREFSEWPLRPKEKKRYTITRSSCLSQMFTEAEPSEIEFEIYARFRPLGGDAVVVGPMKTIKRSGGLLRGLPIAASSRVQKLSKGKKVQAVTALFAAADHVLVAQGKKSKWVPAALLRGNRPDNPPKTDELPADTAVYEKKFGALTLKISDWDTESWRKYSGKIKQGHKMVNAKVAVTVDTSSVENQLDAALKVANDALTTAQTDLATKEPAVETAKTALDVAKGTDGEAAAKDGLKAAKDALKAAKGAVKGAQKAVKSAEKAKAGGVKKFLKTQVKAVNCGSFRLDNGRKALKPAKGSFGKKDCKGLLNGEPVSGTLSFDLGRWDMPFMLSWKGQGGLLQTHNIASQKLATILKD